MGVRAARSYYIEPDSRCPRRNRRWVTRLQEVRLAHGLTLKEASHALGISIGYLNGLEFGKYNPGLSLAVRIASYYEKEIADLWIKLIDAHVTAKQ